MEGKAERKENTRKMKTFEMKEVQTTYFEE